MRYTPILLTLLPSTLAALSIPQKPLQAQNLGPKMPSPPSTNANPAGGSVILSDVLGNDRSINIFAGFTRDFAPISSRFEDSSLNTTILAPVNSAIMALPRKPWEDPRDYDSLGSNAYEGGEGEERAQGNLRRFVEEHVVPWEKGSWGEGERTRTLGGGEVWWEEREGVKVVMPGKIEVQSVASRVHNGEVWILKGVRNYA